MNLLQVMKTLELPNKTSGHYKPTQVISHYCLESVTKKHFDSLLTNLWVNFTSLSWNIISNTTWTILLFRLAKLDQLLCLVFNSLSRYIFQTPPPPFSLLFSVLSMNFVPCSKCWGSEIGRHGIPFRKIPKLNCKICICHLNKCTGTMCFLYYV